MERFFIVADKKIEAVVKRKKSRNYNPHELASHSQIYKKLKSWGLLTLVFLHFVIYLKQVSVIPLTTKIQPIK